MGYLNITHYNKFNVYLAVGWDCSGVVDSFLQYNLILCHSGYDALALTSEVSRL